MIFLDAYEVINRILEKDSELKAKWCILRFDECYMFNAEISAVNPETFVRIIDELLSLGFRFVGGHTDKGVNKVVDVYGSVKAYVLSGSKVNFKNLYSAFLQRVDSPLGLLALGPRYAIFIPTIKEPLETIRLRVVEITKDEKQRINKHAKRHDLKWFGDPKIPILYRKIYLKPEEVRKFCQDLTKFFDEIGFGEI